MPEWQHRFDFVPVPCGRGSSKRMAFREEIQGQIDIEWIFSNELTCEIVLFLDCQTALEESEYADLDNYAKAILDGLKGPGGVMFDDTQIQSLHISWIDTRLNPHFDVTLSCPFSDDIKKKPVTFFEMPDGLYYPLERPRFREGVIPKVSLEFVHFFTLSSLEQQTATKRELRIRLRNHGSDRLHAYERSAGLNPLVRGFHKSRIVESGFHIEPSQSWRAAREKWKQGDAATYEFERLDTISNRSAK